MSNLVDAVARNEGRCIGCFHDFQAEETCGGCGATEGAHEKFDRACEDIDNIIKDARNNIELTDVWWWFLGRYDRDRARQEAETDDR